MLAVINILPSRQVSSPHNESSEVVSVSISLSYTDMVYVPPNASTDHHKDLVNYLTTITVLFYSSVISTYLTLTGQLSLAVQLHPTTSVNLLLSTT